MKKLKVAILDLNNNVVNRGIPYIKRMVENYSDDLTYTVFDVRHKGEIPDTSFDIYISSGGPGSPYDYTGGWDKPYFDLIDKLWQLNSTPLMPSASSRQGVTVFPKKYVFFICHSFQLACLHFKIGEVTQRKSISFGTYPCNKTKSGESELFFKNLPNPFCIADFRDWQVVNADKAYLKAQGFTIMALEKERPHVNLPRAIMAVRFSDTFFGTQFHPEADDEGMLAYFQEPDRKLQVVNNHGQAKYNRMIKDLKDPLKINLTHQIILPAFLNHAIGASKVEEMSVVA
jgi:homoserine O-succinyltransferase/O-acetyltransferase